MWEHFVDIFTGPMSWLTITLICVGIVFCLIEAVIPGFGIFGILGILCEAGAIVVHAIYGESVFGILILFLLITVIILLIFLIFVRSARFGILGRTPIVENRTAIPRNYGVEETTKAKTLIGLEGITITECRPIGKLKTSKGIFEVSAKDIMIGKDVIVKISDVQDSILYVEKINY